jgi:hypothetical protein
MLTSINNTMKAIRIHRSGGPEVLEYEEVPRPIAGSGEVLIRVYRASTPLIGEGAQAFQASQNTSDRPFPGPVRQVLMLQASLRPSDQTSRSFRKVTPSMA